MCYQAKPGQYVGAGEPAKQCRLISGECDRGVALLELAIVIPFFVITWIGLFELGNAIYQYNVLTQYAREGVRLAETIPNLENLPSAAAFNSSIHPNHTRIRTRVNTLHELDENPVFCRFLSGSVFSDYCSLTVSNFIVESSFDAVSQEVRVGVRADYGFIFFPISGVIPLAAEEVGTYLFR